MKLALSVCTSRFVASSIFVRRMLYCPILAHFASELRSEAAFRHIFYLCLFPESAEPFLCVYQRPRVRPEMLAACRISRSLRLPSRAARSPLSTFAVVWSFERRHLRTYTAKMTFRTSGIRGFIRNEAMMTSCLSRHTVNNWCDVPPSRRSAPINHRQWRR